MKHDAIVLGGGFAGLAAATYLARARRDVAVIDTGRPRNRFAPASHGFLGQDGRAPLEILASARDQLLAYPTVHLIEAEATQARVSDDGFSVEIAAGESIACRKLVLAFGLRDTLPVIPGLAERWGRSVLHCPYCHGFEFRDRQLGVLYRTPMSLHQAALVAEWGPTTLYLDGTQLDEGDAKMLAARNVSVESGKVKELVGDGASLSTIVLEDGTKGPISALYISPETSFASPIAQQLGAEIENGPLGPIIRTNEEKMTTFVGVYAAGDIARAPHSVSWSVADGVTAGTSAHRALVFG